MANVELKPLKLTTWRKIALATWHRPGDPSVYAAIEINAMRLMEGQKRYSANRGGAKAPTVTALVARATALTLARHPQINGLIRWGKTHTRESVSVFLQTAVDDEGKELSGLAIHDAEKKSIEQFAQEIVEKSKAIRAGNDPAFKHAKASFALVPVFATRWLLDAMSFLFYTLNLDLTRFGLPRDPFGSVMVTSIGSLGLDEAFGPLVPYSRVPLLIAVGAIRERPVAIDGKIEIAPVLKICATFDHRFIDGVHGAKMVNTVRRLLETDEGLEELGLK